VAFNVGASPGEPGEVEGSAYSRAVSS
jgi:hypothetical protein